MDTNGNSSRTRFAGRSISVVIHDTRSHECRRILTGASDRARKLLSEKKEELRLVRLLVICRIVHCVTILLQLAEALVEHETLDLEEVRKVIQGHKIRQDEKHNVSNVEVTTVTSTPLPGTQPEPVGVVASVSEEEAHGKRAV